MLRKVIIVLICIAFSSTVVLAQINTNVEDDVFIIKKYGLIDNDALLNSTIARGYCIDTIMIMLGADENIINDFIAYYEAAATPMTDILSRYQWLAYCDEIVLGDKIDNEITYVQFAPERAITAQELVSILIRCLKEKSKQSYDLVDNWNIAKEKGLIIPIDNFYNNPNHKLTPQEFCKILYRMLQQNRYVYYDMEDEEFLGHHKHFDQSGTITYMEWQNEKAISREK